MQGQLEQKRIEMLEKIEKKEKKSEQVLLNKEKEQHDKFKDRSEKFNKIISNNIQ
jgi:hypothetical protein